MYIAIAMRGKSDAKNASVVHSHTHAYTGTGRGTGTHRERCVTRCSSPRQKELINCTHTASRVASQQPCARCSPTGQRKRQRNAFIHMRCEAHKYIWRENERERPGVSTVNGQKQLTCYESQREICATVPRERV